MGSVNLDAMREHEDAEKRYAFYTTQKADLDKALADLERAIQQMNRESKKLFEETFDARQRALPGRIFPKMFRGGRAELRLTNPEDMLETGIDIVAQPPGKKLSSIELMSGGEKALTAVSLIFAIFQIKPSPFCILDEVDAPLDEANVGSLQRDDPRDDRPLAVHPHHAHQEDDADGRHPARRHDGRARRVAPRQREGQRDREGHQGRRQEHAEVGGRVTSMEARKTPLLIGAAAAVLAIGAAVVIVRGSSTTIVAELDAGAAASASAAAPAPTSAEPATSASALASAAPASSATAVASAAPSASAATRDAGGLVTAPSGSEAGASAEAGTARPLVVKIDESNDGKTIELAPGQQLVATLDANPTTGFDWAVIKSPPALGAPAMGYVSSSNAAGAPGKRHLTWTLEKALPASPQAVELGYARSFEKGVAPFKTYRFKVRSPSP